MKEWKEEKKTIFSRKPETDGVKVDSCGNVLITCYIAILRTSDMVLQSEICRYRMYLRWTGVLYKYIVFYTWPHLMYIYIVLSITMAWKSNVKELLLIGSRIVHTHSCLQLWTWTWTLSSSFLSSGSKFLFSYTFNLCDTNNLEHFAVGDKKFVIRHCWIHDQTKRPNQRLIKSHDCSFFLSFFQICR